MNQSDVIKSLRKTSSIYSANAKRWMFYKACYDGIEGLLQGGYVTRHERESEANYQRRLDNLYGFSYSEAVVSLFNLYLFEKEITSTVTDVLSGDKSWEKFTRDCDLYKTTFDRFSIVQQREASIYGHVGVLVDKPAVNFETKEEELSRSIYPYVSSYTPLSILDWEEKRDEYNRPYLNYIKLKEGDDLYKLWYPDKWEFWEIKTNDGGLEVAELIDNGVNPLGEIPFVWFYNLKSSSQYTGISDINTVSYIDFSIIRNCSQGEEIIDYSAFPMLRKARDPRGTEEDAVGPTVVLEFDREFPESKPDWLEAKCKEPIEAVLQWLDRKVKEIYRSINSGGVATTQVSSDAKSGVALSMEFRLLNRKLVGKGENVAKVKKEITRLWLKWQNEEDKIEKIAYSPPDTYDVKDLAVDLENAIMGGSFVNSETFSKETQKIMVQRMLPNILPDTLKTIEEEIDAYEPPTFNQPENVGIGEVVNDEDDKNNKE